MNLGSRSFAVVIAAVWIALIVVVRPAQGETVDPRKIYVIDGDTVAIARERIRVLGIDAPETREARCDASVRPDT